MEIGRITVVFSPVGGAGKSLVAANLAERLHVQSRSEVLVLDCALPVGGGIAPIMGLKYARSFAPLLPAIQRASLGTLLRGYATRSDSFGVSVSAIDPSLDVQAQIDPDEIRTYLALSALSYGDIVVDAGSSLGPIILAIFDQADTVVVPVVPRVEAVRRVAKCLQSLQEFRYPFSLFQVVACAVARDAPLSADDISKFLKRRVVTTLPFDPDVVKEAMRSGKPISQVKAKSPVAGALGVLGDAIAQIPSKPKNPAAGDATESQKDVEQERRGERASLKAKVHSQLLKRVDLAKVDWRNVDATTEREVQRHAAILIDELDADIKGREEREKIIREVVDEAIRFGPLEPLLADPDIDEIMINGHAQIYIEKQGVLSEVSSRFVDEHQLRAIIERVIAPLGKRIDESNPMVDARLPDGSRVNAIIPPLSLTGPVVTIRRFNRSFSLEDLYKRRTLSVQMGELLRVCVEGRRNIVVSGGTGSGKTSLLNVLSSFIPTDERIVVIEDTSELRLHQKHLVRLEGKPANIEGKGEITIRDLLRNSLRMRPDRIVIGECRGAEAIDMLQAMNTGHDGSLTTLHANSARDALSRLETMVLMAGLDLPSRAIREQVASAVNLIVQEERMPDGSRKITKIVEVTGMEGNTITTQDLFEFVRGAGEGAGGDGGDFVATGLVPTFVDDVAARGIRISREMFQRTGF